MYNKCNSLFEEFKRYEGQPVEILTDDEKKHCGIDLVAYEDAVRIIDECGRILLIEYSHIATVVEPQMRLQKCCRRSCRCNDDHDRDDDYGNGNDYDGEYGNGNGYPEGCRH